MGLHLPVGKPTRCNGRSTGQHFSAVRLSGPSVDALSRWIRCVWSAQVLVDNKSTNVNSGNDIRQRKARVGKAKQNKKAQQQQRVRGADGTARQGEPIT